MDRTAMPETETPDVEVLHEPECQLMKLKCVRAEGERIFDWGSTVNLPHRARRIKEIRAELTSVECDVGTDEVVVSGVVHKQVFFVRKDTGQICHVAEDINVMTVIPAPGARPDMECQVRAQVLRVVPELTNDGRRVRQTIVLRATVKVFEWCQLNVQLDPRGTLVKALRVVAEDTVSEVVEHIEEIRAIKLRQEEVSHGDVECIVERDQVHVRTTITKEICYVDAANREICEEFEIPFERVIGLPGAQPGMECQAEVRLGRPDARLVFPPGAGVSTEVVNHIPVEVHAKVSELVQARLKEDPHGPLVKIDVVRTENTKQILLEKVVRLRPPARKLFDIMAQVRDVKCIVIPDKAIVQGKIHKQIFYVAPNDCVVHQPEDVPFSTIVEVPGARPGLDCQVHATVEFIHPELLKKKKHGKKPDDDLGHLAEEERDDSAGDGGSAMHAGGIPDHDAWDDRDDLFKKLLQKIVLKILVKVTEERQLRVRLCRDE